MTDSEVTQVLSRIKFRDWHIYLMTSNQLVRRILGKPHEEHQQYIRVEFVAENSNDLGTTAHVASMVRIPSGYKEGNVVKLVWEIIKSASLHEAAEWFWVDDKRPFYPHRL